VSLLGARGRLRIGGSAALVGGAGSLADTRLALLRAELGPRLGVRLGGERFGVTLDGGPLLIVLWAEAEGRSVTIASGAVALAVRAEWTAWRGLLVTLGLEGQVAFSRLRVTRATDELGRVELGTLSLLVGLGWDAPRR
jgi:hypothetical protein